MATRSKTTRRSKAVPALAASANARTVAVARRGIKTGRDFANFMSCLMSDLIEGKVPPQVGNAACHAGGKLLKVVEMQYKYGIPAARKLRASEPARELNLSAM